MKALSKLKAEPGIWMVDAPEVSCKSDELLIKIKKTAICGTDIHIYNWDDWAQKTVPVPMVVGHEFVGEVVEVGSAVKGFRVGDRVSGEGHLTCGFCRNCRAGRRYLCRNVKGIGYDVVGCFSEIFALTADNAFLLPDEISDDLAAVFDPFGNAMHTTLTFDLRGEDVLITGAGPVGCMAAAIAKHAGARYVFVTDVNDYRLQLAEKMGATRVINVARESLADVLRDNGVKEGIDVGLEMSGNSDAFSSMLEVMNHGGKIAVLGILPPDTSIDWNRVIFKALTLQGIYGREIFDTWYKMVSMTQGGLDISPIITHEFAVDDFQQGFDVMRSGQSGKVILNWS